MLTRLVQSADFERVLRTRTRISSSHFAIHHLPGFPDRPGWTPSGVTKRSSGLELSTGTGFDATRLVEDSAADVSREGPGEALGQVWLGAVVPKRHAKRSVTRSLLKRQIRAVVAARHGVLTSGLWVVRLRAPFDRQLFPSAASEAMKHVARGELEQLLASVFQRPDESALRR